MRWLLTALLTVSASAEPALDTALRVVNRAVKCPYRYTVQRRPIDGPGGIYGQYRNGIIYLDRADRFDDASVIAHEIACHDPRLGLGHDNRGKLTNPSYTFVRFPNQYDMPGWNRTYRGVGIVAHVD